MYTRTKSNKHSPVNYQPQEHNICITVFRLFNLCAVLAGIACTVVFAGPPLLSAHWFPATQRVTATAVAVMAYYLGIAAAFVLGKLHASLELVLVFG